MMVEIRQRKGEHERMDASSVRIPYGSESGLDEQELLILESVDHYLEDGLTLKRWWDQVYPARKFMEKFDLARSENHPIESFGFFDQVMLSSRMTPVMGNYQDMFYDQAGAMTDFDTNHRNEWRDQVREFVLHYFMRISNFTQPTASISSDYPDPSSYVGGLSWCTPEAGQQQGFGFSQLFYKRSDTGEIGKFREHERLAITDLREIGKTYEWVVLQVQILDFSLRTKPFGERGPEIVFALNEESYLVLNRDFVIHEEDPDPNVIGRYGFGYAFIKNVTHGVTAYGPGEFDAAFESIQFDVGRNGDVTVRMSFVANRPKQVTSVAVNPVDWGFRIADWASFGIASKLLGPLTNSLPSFQLGHFDPVYAYVSLANLVTGGQAGDMMCISREQLDKRFLLQHFTQHYQTILGTLLTWRQVPNWLDSARLPIFVLSGGLLND
jgi:hypothetical protein